MSARLMRSGVAPMTGALKIVDGSVGSPAIKFNTDGTSGFYKSTNGIGVSVGGTQVAEFLPGGVRGARYIGEIISFSGYTIPDLCVLLYGQTLSRTAYAELWEFAQAEIALGNTFYNNGNGSTTFGIGDCRGRVEAGVDNMGGTSAGRLAPPNMASATLGGTGGTQTHTLTLAEMPVHTHSGTTGIESVTHTHNYDKPSSGVNAAGGLDVSAFSGTSTATTTQASIPHTHAFTTGSAGSGSAHNNVQPTIFTNKILFAGA